MPTLPIYQVDAFADRVFTGNPAAVMPLEHWLEDTALQALAMENNLSETAFFVPLADDDEADFHIRWFTPTAEVPLCGHATLASAWVIFNKLGWPADRHFIPLLQRHAAGRATQRLAGAGFPAPGLRRGTDAGPDPGGPARTPRKRPILCPMTPTTWWY